MAETFRSAVHGVTVECSIGDIAARPDVERGRPA